MFSAIVESPLILSLRETLFNQLAPWDPLGIWRGLLLHQAVFPQTQDLLRCLGWVHVFSLSGVHFWLLWSFIQWVLKRVSPLLGLPAMIALWIGRAVGTALWVGLFLASGGAIGLLRPWGSILIRGLHRRLGIRLRLMSPLFLCWVTEMLLTQGHLSEGARVYYLAVGGGLTAHALFFQTLKSRPHFLSLLVSLGSCLFLSAYDIFLNCSFCVLTPLFNLFSLPLLGFGFATITLSTALHAPRILELLEFSNQALEWGMHLSLQTPALVVVQPFEFLGALSLAIFGRLLYRRKSRPSPEWGVFLLAVFAVFEVREASFWGTPAVSRVIQFDVGQGDSALLQTPNSTGLFDVGPSPQGRPSKWLRRFATYQIQKIDWMGFSHLDADHIGGAETVLSLLRPHCVLIPDAVWAMPRSLHLRARFQQKFADLNLLKWSERSQCFWEPRLSELTLQAGHSKTDRANEVMAGLELWLSPRLRYVNLGDAPALLENQFLPWLNQDDLKTETPLKTFLKVSHHGSSTSSELGFLARLAPSSAWISVGAHNLYHHPAPVVIAHLQTLRIPFRRTDQEGDLILTTQTR